MNDDNNVTSLNSEKVLWRRMLKKVDHDHDLKGCLYSITSFTRNLLLSCTGVDVEEKSHYDIDLPGKEILYTQFITGFCINDDSDILTVRIRKLDKDRRDYISLVDNIKELTYPDPFDKVLEASTYYETDLFAAITHYFEILYGLGFRLFNMTSPTPDSREYHLCNGDVVLYFKIDETAVRQYCEFFILNDYDH